MFSEDIESKHWPELNYILISPPKKSFISWAYHLKDVNLPVLLHSFEFEFKHRKEKFFKKIKAAIKLHIYS